MREQSFNDGPGQPSGSCPKTGKVRYATDADASIALARVQEVRAAQGRGQGFGKPPERYFYDCSHCFGWHLSSMLPIRDTPLKADGETWEEYAHRLERRVAEQRKMLDDAQRLRKQGGNRQARGTMERLESALAKMTLRWEGEVARREALERKLIEGGRLRSRVTGLVRRSTRER